LVAGRVNRRHLLAALAALPLVGCATVATPPGDIASADLTLTAPDGRAVPVRVTWPRSGRGALPLLLLSHGANGTLDGLANLQRGLTRGRVVAAPQHLDSESNPNLATLDRNGVWPTRVADVRLIADSIAAIERATGRRIDASRLTAGGHSYGALVAQALGGAEVGGPGAPPRSWRDPRVRAVVAFSPPGPVPPLVATDGWAKLAVPQFVQTGTADVLPMIAPKWEAHMASYEASSVPGSVLWVGRGVDHYFGDLVQRLAREAPDQSRAFEAALAVADKFLASAEGGSAARRWIAGAGPTAAFADVTERYEVRR